VAKVKLCECGCGEPAPLATVTSKVKGTVKGKPQRFVLGHSGNGGYARTEHKLSNIDVDKNTATCAVCGFVKVWRGPNGNGYICSIRGADTGKKSVAKHQKTRNEDQRKRRLWTAFRLTTEDWDNIFSYQKGVCAITGRPAVTIRLSVDHNHHTGLVRGLLSLRANRGLAYFNDDPALLRKAADYLENPPATLALGKKVFGLIGQGRGKKKMVYGSENGPIKPEKKARNDKA
jgi:hypothetical protein